MVIRRPSGKALDRADRAGDDAGVGRQVDLDRRRAGGGDLRRGKAQSGRREGRDQPAQPAEGRPPTRSPAAPPPRQPKAPARTAAHNTPARPAPMNTGSHSASRSRSVSSQESNAAFRAAISLMRGRVDMQTSTKSERVCAPESVAGVALPRRREPVVVRAQWSGMLADRPNPVILLLGSQACSLVGLRAGHKLIQAQAVALREV